MTIKELFMDKVHLRTLSLPSNAYYCLTGEFGL